MTAQEELERERRRVVRYREALEAMTKSRDLYREAAEQAHEALAAYRDTPLPVLPQQRPSARNQSPLQQLTRTFERLRLPAWGQRPENPDADPDPEREAEGSDRV